MRSTDSKSVVERQYSELCEEKAHLEEELKTALQELKEMNEVERMAIAVNESPSVASQQHSIEQIHNQMAQIESQIQQLKDKMQRDSAKLHEVLDSFVVLKNEILGIEMDEEASLCVCFEPAL